MNVLNSHSQIKLPPECVDVLNSQNLNQSFEHSGGTASVIWCKQRMSDKIRTNAKYFSSRDI